MGKKKLNRLGKGVPDIAFRFGAKKKRKKKSDQIEFCIKIPLFLRVLSKMEYFWNTLKKIKMEDPKRRMLPIPF